MVQRRNLECLRQRTHIIDHSTQKTAACIVKIIPKGFEAIMSFNVI